jgi:Tol biopolymer transport system component
MRRGLQILAVAFALPVAASIAAGSGSAEPHAPECVPQGALSPLAWSRDGRWVAFNRSVGPRVSVLTVADLRSGRFRALKRSEDGLGFGLSWSPTGATLVAVSEREIHSGAPDERLRLIARGCFGAWGPKGKRLAYATGGWIVTTNLDGSAKKRIVRADGVGSWSPDGRRLAVVRRVPPTCPRPGIPHVLRSHVYRFHGGLLARVTGDRRLINGIDAYRGGQSSGTFSPDGRWLAFGEGTPCAADHFWNDYEPDTFVAGREDPVGRGSGIWAPSSRLLVLDGVFRSGGTVVTHRGAVVMEIPEGEAFTWSPDSTRLAYVRLVSVPRWHEDLFVAAVDRTGRVRRVIRDASDPAWSPDGSRIAFQRIIEGPSLCSELFVVSADGGVPRRLVGC